MLSTKSLNAVDQNADDTRSNSLSKCERISKRWNRIGPLRLGVITVIVGLFFIGQGEALAAASVKEINDPVPLYGTFVLQFSAPSATGSKFQKFPQVTFTKGSTSKKVEGFFNGNGNGSASGTLWLARFMPNAQGTWNYSWSFEGSSGSGSFTVSSRTNSKNHGHVKRSGKFLKHDDGTGFHYRGSNWPGALNLRVNPAQSCAGCPYFSDTEWVNYTKRLEETGHNGTYMTAIENTMNNDRASFDLAWLKRVDWAIEQAGKRGLYLFSTFFNTWGRSTFSPFSYTKTSSEQLLDPWNGSRHQTAKKFFIRYIAARFAGYYNVMWELGNEVEVSPNSGSAFASAANKYYVPWIRQYDPYDLPITASENTWKSINLDIGGLHQNQTISLSAGKPIIHTELVRGGAPEVMWKTTTYRNPAYRHYYRRAMWKGMAEGGSGTIEGSIMFYNNVFNNSLTSWLNDGNIKKVMEDHGRLGKFMDAVPEEVFNMSPLGSIGNSSNSYKSRGKAGSVYMAYFYNLKSAPASITLNVSLGSYRARWFSPSTGQYSSAATVNDGDKITSPFSNQKDMALELVSVPEDTEAPVAPRGLTLK